MVKPGGFSRARVVGSDDLKMGMRGGPVHKEQNFLARTTRALKHRISIKKKR